MATLYSTNGCIIIGALLLGLGIWMFIFARQRVLPVPAPKSESSNSGVVKEEAQSSTLPKPWQNLSDRRLKGRRTPTRSHDASGGTDYNTPPPASIGATDTLTINPHLTNPKPARGSTKTISSPPTTPPSTAYASRTPISRRRRRKALLIGLNYTQSGKLDPNEKPVRKMDPLKHAVRDAWRFASALTRIGYAKEEMRIVTDEPNQPLASSQYILECLDWLIQGVCKGDRLFLMYSGHCVNPGFMDRDTEPYLAAGDHMPIHKSTLHERLIGKVPAGAELVTVLGFYNAASMALCSTLDNSDESVVTQHTLWKSLVGAVGEENRWRKERDAKKPIRVAPNLRVQQPQLWSSQEPRTPSSPNPDPFIPCKPPKKLLTSCP